MRWNTAFAYLDSARQLPNLTICGDTLVDRIEIAGSRAVSVQVETPDGRREIHADWVILAAGAYSTPAILQRSGIGPAKLVRQLGIKSLVDSPVGSNLHDQAFRPAVSFGEYCRWSREVDQLTLHASGKVSDFRVFSTKAATDSVETYSIVEVIDVDNLEAWQEVAALPHVTAPGPDFERFVDLSSLCILHCEEIGRG